MKQWTRKQKTRRKNGARSHSIDVFLFDQFRLCRHRSRLDGGSNPQRDRVGLCWLFGSAGDVSFAGAVAAGTVGGTVAQLFLYWMGYYGGRPFLDQYGKYVLIQKKHLDVAERWFAKFGPGVIFSARFIPVVRHAISIPAGIARMKWLPFTIYTVLAIIPWSILFIWLGEQLGQRWRQIDEMAAPYVRPAIAAAVAVAAIYIVWQRRRRAADENERMK